MIDFSKLIHRTPEEKEAARIERERQDQEYLERLDRLADERVAQVNALVELMPKLTSWEQDFVKSMHYLATTFDMSGKLGGELGTLSDKRLSSLNKIVAKYLTHPAAAENDEGPPLNF